MYICYIFVTYMFFTTIGLWLQLAINLEILEIYYRDIDNQEVQKMLYHLIQKHI